MLTAAIDARLRGDASLVAMLADYNGRAAVFTIDPAPGDASMPYIVTAGEVTDSAYDTKTTLGRELRRDVRCYAPVTGTAATIEAIAERVRALLHRQPLTVGGYDVWMAECSGPIVADEPDAYGRIVTVRTIMTEV